MRFTLICLLLVFFHTPLISLAIMNGVEVGEMDAIQTYLVKLTSCTGVRIDYHTVLTTAHCFPNATNIRFLDGDEYVEYNLGSSSANWEIVGTGAHPMLVVIHIEPKKQRYEDFRPLRVNFNFADNFGLQKGDSLLAVGYGPNRQDAGFGVLRKANLQFFKTLKTGIYDIDKNAIIVEALNKPYVVRFGDSPASMGFRPRYSANAAQAVTDLQIPLPGDSGGPLFKVLANGDFELIGILEYTDLTLWRSIYYDLSDLASIR